VAMAAHVAILRQMNDQTDELGEVVRLGDLNRRELHAVAHLLGLGELRDGGGPVPEHVARALVADGILDISRRNAAHVSLRRLRALLRARLP